MKRHSPNYGNIDNYCVDFIKRAILYVRDVIGLIQKV